jgi:hypothetical protein
MHNMLFQTPQTGKFKYLNAIFKEEFKYLRLLEGTDWQMTLLSQTWL